MSPSTIIAILGCLLLCVGCRPSASNIRFILPDGYRGPIAINESESGVKVRRDGGFWVFEIPDNGHLVVRSIRPLRLINLPAQVAYRSGESISWAVWDSAEIAEWEKIKVHQLGADSEGYFYFFVGTYLEAKSYWDQPPWQRGRGGALPFPRERPE